MIYLLLILTLNFSCVEKKSTEKEVNNSELKNTSETDTLKFTSGIRAIFQDSKGNYWFGSLQEGVAVYNGKSFKYFTINEGISDNQIHSIQEDKEGLIWINTQTGVSSFNGSTITNHSKSGNENYPNVAPNQDNESTTNNWMKSDRDLWFEAGNKAGGRWG